MASRIDTLATHRAFKEAGIVPAHAEVIVEAINRADDRLATKDDVLLARSELGGEIESVRTELSSKIESVETRLATNIGLEIASVRTDLGGEIASFRAEVNERFVVLDGRFAALDGRFAAVDGQFAAVDGRFIALEGQVAAIRSHLRMMMWFMGFNAAATVALIARLFIPT